VPFASKDGKVRGWKVVIPGNHPLATPAVVDGRVFLGGGFSSHEFYAFDAKTGKLLWQYQTGDDGPTAAVVQDGHVVFNTESCELEVLTVDGKPVWKKWLGDPLMSMPAIDQGKVYMAYPNSRGDRSHYLACFELKTGKEEWKEKIAGEIITAPVIDDGKVYLATLEGTLSCFGQSDGKLVWQEKRNATSSPAVWNGQCFFSRREEVVEKKEGQDVRQQTERLTQRGIGPKEPLKDLPATTRNADYLDYGKRATSPSERANQTYDSNVGFAQGKGDANIEQAIRNLGQATVAGVWAYQGSRPFVYQDRLYSAMGDALKCVDPKTEKVLWKKVIEHQQQKQGEPLDSVLTPPAVVNDKVFVGTIFGEVWCLAARTGEVLWSVNVGEPIVFQPVVAMGRVYISTNKGSLFCLETGDPTYDGWLMGGANAAHNGRVK
jgi:Ca-activated chloride channel family protein